MSVLPFTIYTILSFLLLGINSIEGYHGVSLTGLPAYVTRGQTILPRCIFRTDNFSPSTSNRSISLIVNKRRVKELSERVILWRFDSGGKRKMTEFSHVYTVNEDTTFKCTVVWGGGGDGNVKEAVFTVPVGCPLRLESQSTTIMDTSSEEYGVNIVVSGKDVGPTATIIPPPSLNTPNKSPMTLAVTSKVITGGFHLDQKEATLFSVRWRLNPDWDGLCDEEAQTDRDYTLEVSNAYEAGTALSVKFNVQYPAVWVKTARSLFVIADSDKQNVTLHCSVCALPQASFTWTLCGAEVSPDDVIISQSGAELTIPEVGDGHVGTYQCIATNVIDRKPLRETFEISLSFTDNFSDATCRNAGKVWLYTGIVIITIIIAIGIAIAVWKRKELKGILVNLCGTLRGGCPNTRYRRNKVDDSHRTDVLLKQRGATNLKVTWSENLGEALK